MNIEKIIGSMSLEEKVALCSGTDFWRSKANERLGIPSVMMCDGPHGLRKQSGPGGDHLGINESIDTVCFPTASALASSFDRELLHTLGETLGNEGQAENIAMLLGPGVNIKRSPLCGRNFEYFSEDPYLAGELGASYIKGLQSKGVAACVKHYAANNQETRRLSVDAVIDERTLHEIYLPAFEAAVKSGKTRSIMCSYNQVNGEYASQNEELLADILRDKWGFDGMTVSDWGAVKDRVQGIWAGLDLEMPGPGMQDQKITKALEDGTLEEQALDRSVRNILQFLDDSQKMQQASVSYDLKKDHELAADFATECAVLMKNEDGVLPISKTAKVVFIGEFADKPLYQGSGSSHINAACVTNAVESARGLNTTFSLGFRAYDKETDPALLEEALEAAKAAEIVVVFAGLPDDIETEGADRDDMDLPNNQNELIAAVTAVQPRTIVVLHGGAPVTMPWINQVPALLNMYLAGDNVGAATISLLYGDVNPSGKLAETYPLQLEDNPSFLNFPGDGNSVEYREGIYVGYRYYDKKKMRVLFPFGHGLSFTSFSYSDISFDKTEMDDSEILTVSCKVKNTGNVPGREVIQLYVRDLGSSIGRPIRELKDFAKVQLVPGEEKTVSFTLEMRAFAFYDVNIHDWRVETGRFMVEIGASSRDIRLSKQIEVKSTQVIKKVFTRDSFIEDILKTEKGRTYFDGVMKQLGIDGDSQSMVSASDTEQLGEGGKRMLERTMMHITLSAVMNFGRLSEEEIDGLLEMLNS